MAAVPRVTVLGSMNMDIAVTVPELPGPGATVLGSSARFAPGGKGANQAVAAARLGARVRMAGCAGADEFGARLLAALRAESVDISAVRQVIEVPSGLALITVDPQGENMITVAAGANAAVGEAEVAAACADPGDVLVISAEIPVAAITAALSRARGGSGARLLNLAPVPPEAVTIVATGVEWLVVNEPEASVILGRPVAGLPGARAAAADLASAGARHAVVTAAAAGAAFAGPDGSGTVGGFQVSAVDSVGAGDTFVGALATAVGMGTPPGPAVRAACAAAAVAVTRPGTQDAMPHSRDVIDITGVDWPPSARQLHPPLLRNFPGIREFAGRHEPPSPGEVPHAGDTVREVEAGSREYVLGEPGQELLNQVLNELTATFAVVGDGRPERVRRTWLDTFDWRLYRAGFTLQHVGARGAGELSLAGPDGQRRTAPAGPSRWPALAEALPAGPVRDRVARIVGIRALLPAGTAVSNVRELRLLNEDEKTVARVVVDEMSVPAHAGMVLPTRLAVTEVRGYQAAARRARRVLAGAAGVSPSRLTALDAALHAAGRRGASYSGKVDVVLRPAMAGREAVTAVLLEQLDTVEANVDGVLRDIDTEFLHDLRVAVRRTRSALKLVGDVLPGEFTPRFASEFRWLGDLTTPVRDLDVQLLSFPLMTAGLVAATPADLAPFRAFLARRRAAERRKLNRGLRSARFASVAGDWRKALLGTRDPAGATGPRAADLSADRTRRAHGRVIRLGASITDASPAENLHTLRKRCKELRYMLEFFASLYDPDLFRAVIADLKRLQDCLGEFQDSQVEREEIQALAAVMLAQQAAPASTLLAMGELAAQLAVRQQQARAEFAQRFTEFAGIPGRRRIAALTAGAAS